MSSRSCAADSASPAWAWSASDFQARIGDVGPFEVELGEVLQAAERASPVSEIGLSKQCELHQIGQAGQVDEPCVGDLRARQQQSFEVGQLAELRQAGIADLRAFQVELLEVLQLARAIACRRR